MKIEEYLLGVISGEEDGFMAKVTLVLLTLFSYLYAGIVKVRSKLYQWGIKQESILDAKVISIGNVTVGGTGKTPIVQLLATTLLQAGYKVVVLNRGYKAGFSGEVGIVSNGEEMLMTAKQAGDEAYMLATSLPKIPIIIGSKRNKTGEYACQHFNPDFIILDDAFQHWQVARDYDLVVVDATNPFDNGYLLPRGRLREPLSSLERAHVFLLTKTDQVTATKLKEIKERLIKINPAAAIITTKHQPTYLRKLTNLEQKKIDLNGKRVLAVSGIGNPKAFERTIEDLGAEVVGKIRFRDHHQYSKDEIMDIFTAASKNNVDKIITTEKDAVSIDNDLIKEIGQEKIDFEVLGIEIKLIDSQDKFDELISKLEVSRCR